MDIVKYVDRKHERVGRRATSIFCVNTFGADKGEIELHRLQLQELEVYVLTGLLRALAPECRGFLVLSSTFLLLPSKRRLEPL